MKDDTLENQMKQELMREYEFISYVHEKANL
jgi:hypothetical protein